MSYNKKGKAKLIVILGSTASGKTSMSIGLAKKFNGEIISADSRQVYKQLDIGTDKITKNEMKGIQHYLLDVASPKRRFTAIQYKKLALAAIKQITQKGKVPFLVGGTGFYISAVVDNLIIPEIKPDWRLRKELEKKSTEQLFILLKKKDLKRSIKIDKYNRRRLIRALEIIIKTGQPTPRLGKKSLFNVLILGIKKNPDELKSKIEKRSSKWLTDNSIIREVKKIKRMGLSWKRIEEFGLEYRYVAKYLQGEISRQQMTEKCLQEVKQYAKRQMTWFKKDKRIYWIKNSKEADKLIKKFLTG